MNISTSTAEQKETKHSRIRIIIVYTFVAFSLKYLLLTFYAALFVRVKKIYCNEQLKY